MCKCEDVGMYIMVNSLVKNNENKREIPYSLLNSIFANSKRVKGVS